MPKAVYLPVIVVLYIDKGLKTESLSLQEAYTCIGIITGRNRVRLEELVGVRERWKDIIAASMAGRAYRMITECYMDVYCRSKCHVFFASSG